MVQADGCPCGVAHHVGMLPQSVMLSDATKLVVAVAVSVLTLMSRMLVVNVGAVVTTPGG